MFRSIAAKVSVMVWAVLSAAFCQEAALGAEAVGSVELESASPFELEQGWSAKMHCRAPAAGITVIKIGRAIFGIPETSLRMTLAGAISRLSKSPNGKFVQELSADTGCPENPLAAMRITIQPAASNLPQTLVLSLTPPHEGLSKKSQALLDLRDHAAERCQPTPNTTGLVTCGITENSNGRSEPIVYILATDKTLVQHSGAPLHLRCFVQPSLLCGVEDDLDGGVTFEIGVSKEDFVGLNPEKLTALHDKVRAVVDGLRKTP